MTRSTHTTRRRESGHTGSRRIATIALAIALLASGIATPAFAETAPSPDRETISDSRTGASATPDRIRPPSRIKYTYVVLSRTDNWTSKGRQLGICKVSKGASGGRCTISASYEVEASVGLSFGLSKGVISAGINVNGEKKVTGSVSWTSPKARAGSAFKAWAVGTRVIYRIQKWKVSKAGTRTIKKLIGTSPNLSAFIPVQGFDVGQ